MFDAYYVLKKNIQHFTVDVPVYVYIYIYIYMAKGDWDFRISALVKNPEGTDI